MPLADNQRLACVKRGLYLVRDDDGSAFACFVSQPPHAHPPKIVASVMAASQKTPNAFHGN